MKKNNNSLFFTCSLIELIGRTTRQKRSDVVSLMGENIVSHIYQHADTLHCEPIAKTADYYIDFCHIPTGDFDNVASCKYAVPTYWDIGKVYARLIEDIQMDDVMAALMQVYHSKVSDSISYYNSDFFYQPRDFIKEEFLAEVKAETGKSFSKPAIRFRGFTDAWEQRRLGDYLETSLEKNTECTYTVDDVLSVSGDFGVINQIEFQGRSFAGASVANYGILHVGEVVYTKSPLKASPYGIIKTNKGKTGIVSVLYGVYHPKENLHSDLVQTYFEQNARLNNYLRPLVNKGAKNTLLISDDDALQGEVIFPLQKAEQEKISSFFKSLDRLITLHQRKYDKLTKIKKSMLEKLFPKNDSKFPEIRFHGFTDAWEQRKLSDFVQREATFRISSAEYPCVEYEDVVAEEGRLNKDIRQKGTQKTGVEFDGTQVLYGKLRPYLHNWLNPNFQGVAVGDWWVLRPIGVDKNFLFRLIQTKHFDEVANQSSGSKMPRADWNLVSNTEFIIPSSVDEQRQIAETFNQLDSLLTLHQRELDRLRKIKKSCLEKMFV